MKRSLSVVLLAVVLLAAACGEPMLPPAVHHIVAEFDPSLVEPKVPLPNDIAIDPATGLIDVADPHDANDAEVAFNAWLRTLDGFPVTSVATVQFSGDLDAASVNPSTVRVYDLTDAQPVAVTVRSITYDIEEREVRVEHPWSAGRLYGVAVIAGPSAVRGANLDSVVGSDAFRLLQAKYPLVTCSDLASPDCRSANPGIRGKTIDDERTKALKMEKARLAAGRVMTFLEASGTPRESLASVWTFRTARELLPSPVVNFQPAVRAIPFPCDALLKNGKVALPAEPKDDQLVDDTKAQLARLDGFSTTAAIVTEHNEVMGATGFQLNASSVTAAQFKLVDLDQANADVGFNLSLKSNPDQVVLTPAKPLKSHHRHAVVWSRGARAQDGSEMKTSAAWALMTAGAKFTDGGKSRIRTLGDAQADDLERLRLSVVDGVAAAEAKGVAKSDVLLAWTFTTQTTGATLAELRGKPEAWALPTAISGVAPLQQVALLSAVSNFAGADFHMAVRAGFEGVFTSGNALDPNGTELDLSDPMNPRTVSTEGPFTDATLATPRREQLKFMLVLPKTPKHADGRIPIIIFQHGITRFRRDALIISNAIARAGYATLAIDHPLHGDRSYCTAPADCAIGTCTENRCPVGGYRISSGLLEQQMGTPAISGLKFSSTTNLAATRDQIRQLVIDTAQLIRVVKDTTAGIGGMNVDDTATAGITERLEPAELGYIGMSLGSVMGAVVVAANPEITSATLNVGGASPTDILTQATVSFLMRKRDDLDAYLLAKRGLASGSQGYEDFYAISRWMLDTADGQNFGRNYIDEPLPGYPKKRIFLSWVQGDPWVPNPTTQLLINSIDHVTAPMNFGEHQWMAGGDHSFMMNPLGAQCLPAQNEAVGWIATP